MPENEVLELHPTGWESDPADEYFKLSTLDYCSLQVYNNYALFFKLPDAVKPKTVPVLKRGLEITISQCRQLCGVLEAHPEGGLCFHKKRESTVQFHVQWLDGPEAEDRYPSFDDLEKRHFVSQALGDLNTWCVAPMTYGDKPEAQPASKPRAAAFKASFIRGGLVLMMHHLHYANDVMGWAGELHQLAENCAAVWKSWDNPVLPGWDTACLDYSRFTKSDVPEDQQVDGPPVPPSRHIDQKPGGQWLLFHLPKSKIAELKEAASPAAGAGYWISSYDAYTAFIWRMVVKHKAELFNPDPKEVLVWAEAIDMRRRFHDPPVPRRTQGNVLNLAFNMPESPAPPLTVEDVISEVPLSRVAWYIRQMTNSSTEETFDALLSSIAPVRDKTTLYLRMDSFHPMTNFATDWRDTEPCEADFGFAKPHAFRHPFDTVSSGLAIVYPVRTNSPPAGDDEGHEFIIGLEKEVARHLVDDPEWNRYFEFRGVDSEEKVYVDGLTAAV
ncbi:hypothetical protein B0T19DRAFT_423740 [Cercophora scortea]|uniref:Trichothecene 3-O-acetyltransferase-like N-terminal domain-containing protein n=1 Tax=Cercophora scortea TaxID=314031 RepID=A0AAE0IN74_9PEZI|nr:hypothetical protein B0T19DRAFT_423740 [Cercophora scortea]